MTRANVSVRQQVWDEWSMGVETECRASQDWMFIAPIALVDNEKFGAIYCAKKVRTLFGGGLRRGEANLTRPEQ